MMSNIILRIALNVLPTNCNAMVCTAPYYPIDPTLQTLNPIDMYKEALITFCLSI